MSKFYLISFYDPKECSDYDVDSIYILFSTDKGINLLEEGSYYEESNGYKIFIREISSQHFSSLNKESKKLEELLPVKFADISILSKKFSEIILD